MTEAQRLRRTFNPVAKRHYQRRSLLVAMLSIAAHVGSAVAAAALAHHVSSAQPGVAGLVAMATAVFWIGTRFRALGNMLHECSHGMLVPAGPHNRILGHLLGVLDFTAFERYTREHRTHHAHLGDPGKDLDFVPRARFRFAEPVAGPGLRHILVPLLLLHVPYYLRPVLFDRREPVAVQAARLGYLAGLAALAQLVIGWYALAVYFVLPYVTTYQMMRYWSDAIDHAGIIGSAEELHRTRNHCMPWRVLDLIFFPRNDAYHLVHHLFPNVPTHRYADVHRALLDDPSYAARRHRLFQPLIAQPDKGNACHPPPRALDASTCARPITSRSSIPSISG